MTEKEKTIQHYMKALQLSRSEAEELYEDDKEGIIREEGENLDKKAKTITTRNKSKSTNNIKKVRPRKIDENKAFLLSIVENALKLHDQIIISAVNNETSIDFKYNNVAYSIKLIKHR